VKVLKIHVFRDVMQYWLLFGLEMLNLWGIIVAEVSSLLECYTVTTCK